MYCTCSMYGVNKKVLGERKTNNFYHSSQHCAHPENGAVSLLTQLANTFIYSTFPDLRYLPIIIITRPRPFDGHGLGGSSGECGSYEKTYHASLYACCAQLGGDLIQHQSKSLQIWGFQILTLFQNFDTRWRSEEAEQAEEGDENYKNYEDEDGEGEDEDDISSDRIYSVIHVTCIQVIMW